MMLRVWTSIQSKLLSDEGASLVEYALLVALIAAVAIFAVRALGNEVDSTIDGVVTELEGGGTTVP